MERDQVRRKRKGTQLKKKMQQLESNKNNSNGDLSGQRTDVKVLLVYVYDRPDGFTRLPVTSSVTGNYSVTVNSEQSGLTEIFIYGKRTLKIIKW
ncbi:hypothetical protein KP79_PYT09684 [Mizuhopecten yessoensis]|uniref:Uncharacterized protein n=2 Tax=Mizuhopecten yessoensis TaxID=6573 RepID=A0A210QCE9_MIZYE|nr:hypothetical protein KP79_PYT09684 [Mizuhopecten yessoensis]